MLGQRIMTAVVLLALLVPALAAQVPWPFLILTLILIAAAGWEWARLNGLAMTPALLLGTDLMATFRRVSLDFRARKVRFQLKKCGTTGVVVTSDSTFYTRLSSGDDSEVCRR